MPSVFWMPPDTKKVCSVSLLGAHNKKDSVKSKPASLLAVFYGKAFNGMPPSLCGGQAVELSTLPVAVAQSDQQRANKE